VIAKSFRPLADSGIDVAPNLNRARSTKHNIMEATATCHNFPPWLHSGVLVDNYRWPCEFFLRARLPTPAGFARKLGIVFRYPHENPVASHEAAYGPVVTTCSALASTVRSAAAASSARE